MIFFFLSASAVISFCLFDTQALILPDGSDLTSVCFLSSSAPGSSALPSNMKYFGSAHEDEDADEEEEEEEEEEENEQKKPSASNITASCQATPRRSKAPSRVITNGNGTFSSSSLVSFFLLYLFPLDCICCAFSYKQKHQSTKYIIAGP